jgi:hypothetical protein
MATPKVYCPACRGLFRLPPDAPADALAPCPHCGRWAEFEAVPGILRENHGVTA